MTDNGKHIGVVGTYKPQIKGDWGDKVYRGCLVGLLGLYRLNFEIELLGLLGFFGLLGL